MSSWNTQSIICVISSCGLSLLVFTPRLFAIIPSLSAPSASLEEFFSHFRPGRLDCHERNLADTSIGARVHHPPYHVVLCTRIATHPDLESVALCVEAASDTFFELIRGDVHIVQGYSSTSVYVHYEGGNVRVLTAFNLWTVRSKFKANLFVLYFADVYSDDEEYHQLEDAVNHRRHIQRAFVKFSFS